MSELQKNEDKKPAQPELDFSYYDKSKQKFPFAKLFVITASVVVFIIAVTAAFKALNKISERSDVGESSAVIIDSDGPYADDTVIVSGGVTDMGLHFVQYERHVRITEFDYVFSEGDIIVPEEINGVPVTEIDYYVFAFSKLQTLSIQNPECILFDDGEMPPIDPNTMILGKSGSAAEEYAKEHGNRFALLY